MIFASNTDDSSRKSSTIAFLHPMDHEEPSFRFFKNSLRMQGSLQMSLRRPSRVADFSRQYIPGDPVNRIDWKAFARSDQLILREKRDEACAQILIFIDLAPSMFWPSKNHIEKIDLPPTKFEIAVRLACHLAVSHLSVGDQVVMALSQDISPVITHEMTARSPGDILSLFTHLRDEAFSSDALVSFFSKGQKINKKIDTGYLISDGLSYPIMKNPVICANPSLHCFLHVLSSLETDVLWVADDWVYFDEYQESKEYFGRYLKDQNHYLKSLFHWMASLRVQINKNNGWYMNITDQTALLAYARFLEQMMQGGLLR